MGEVFSIHRRGLFTLEEARRLVPIIHRITIDVSQKVDELIEKLESKSDQQRDIVARLEDQINGHILAWNEKVRKLGAIPKGLWLVDFEFVRGYYCWKFPEEDLQYWHTSDDGFSGRRPLEDLKVEKIKEGARSKSSNRPGPNQRPTGRF